MIPLAIPNLAGREAEYLQDCIKTTFVSSVGPFVDRFEEMVASASGAKYAVATSAGTTGLHTALTAVGASPGDLVILPSLTFIASANAISHCGAEPWLMDVDAQSWTLDPTTVARELKENTRLQCGRLVHKESGRRIAAMMPVYTLGMPANMSELVTLAKEYRIPVVADAAAALGAKFQGQDIGNLDADLSVISFNGNKTVTAGGGGAVIGNNKEFIDLVRHLSTTAKVGANYDHDRVGFNYRMTNLQAAVGCAQMENLEMFVEKKHQIRKAYEEALTNLSGISFFPSPEWAESADWFCGFVLEEGDSATLRENLRQKGIDARPFWKPMHLQAPYAKTFKSDMTASDEIWEKIITLPCSTGITDEQVEQVIKAVKEVLFA